MIELDWRTSTLACALHAVSAVASGRRLADERMADLVIASAVSLIDSLTQIGLTLDEFLRAAVPLASESGAVACIAKLPERENCGNVGQQPEATLSAKLKEIEAAMMRVYPDLPDQLQLRIKPLRAAWDARGPGLWKVLSESLGCSIEPETSARAKVNVFSVMPLLGGAGSAISLGPESDGAILIEGVLANPHPALPEVVRLAWLLGQGSSGRGETRLRHSTERIPAVLRAAESVELVRYDRATLRLALDAWHISSNTAELDELAGELWARFRP